MLEGTRGGASYIPVQSEIAITSTVVSCVLLSSLGLENTLAYLKSIHHA